MVRKRKRSWSDTELINVVKKSYCLSDVLTYLNLVKGGSYKTIKYHIDRLKLDTSHFLSKSDLLIRARKSIKIKSNNDLFIQNGSYNDYKRVKVLIIKHLLIPYKCSICQIEIWHGQKLNLQMDHINGIKTDNRLSNLRFLCPNCHSLTDNFCGKNIKKCISCNENIHKSSTWCVNCRVLHRGPKINWPLIDEIKSMVQKLGYVETGRRLGVSDNAVRKKIKKENMFFNVIGKSVEDWNTVQVVDKEFHKQYGTGTNTIFNIVKIDNKTTIDGNTTIIDVNGSKIQIDLVKLNPMS